MDTENGKHLTSEMPVKKPHDNVMVTDHEHHHTHERSLICCVYAGAFHSNGAFTVTSLSKVTPVVI